MNNRAVIFCAAALGAAFLLLTCSKKNPAGPDEEGNNNQTVQTYLYTKTLATITVSIPQGIDTTRYCDPLADTLVTAYDTVPAHVKIFPYVISAAGDTLTIYDTIDFMRSGTGSGLIGSWISISTVEDFPIRLAFTDTAVAMTFENVPYCYADDFIDYDWALDSASYAVSLQRVSCTQVRLTGDSTHEVVTITWNNSGDKTFSSSDPGHVQHTWYENPASCPNEENPDWYYAEFLNGNFRQ
jgi:hypothetical protein